MMVAGVVSSNQRVLPFKETSTLGGTLNPLYVQPGSTTANSTATGAIANLNEVLYFVDIQNKDVLESSSKTGLTGWTATTTSDTISDSISDMYYENGRYFWHSDSRDVMYTGTTIAGLLASSSINIGDMRSKYVWYAPASCWFVGGDSGTNSPRVKYSTNGTTWSNGNAPSVSYRIQDCDTNGTILVVCTEAVSTTKGEMAYTSSTSTSFTWTGITVPFGNGGDITYMEYFPNVGTDGLWISATDQGSIAYSYPTGTPKVPSSWTLKDCAQGGTNGTMRFIFWKPLNRWVGISKGQSSTSGKQAEVVISPTSTFETGTWTNIGRFPTAEWSLNAPIVSLNNTYILVPSYNQKIFYSL